MKRTIKLALLLFGLIFAYNSSAQAQDFKVGAGLAFGSGVGYSGDLDNDLGLRVDGYYGITPEIRIGGDFTFYLPKSVEQTTFGGTTIETTSTVWELNLNGHYIFYDEDNLSIYGLGGINITGLSTESEGGGSSQSNSNSEAGLNLGGGLDYGMDFGTIFGEVKLGNLGGDADQFVIGAGVRFGL